jgi:hypothetical protein
MNAASIRLHEVVTIARRLLEQFGESGRSVIDDRARILADAGEADDARFWADVARAMRLLGANPAR